MPVSEQLRVALSDRYRIEREIGAGGMATVYLAEDLKHRRKVALKVLRPELAAVLGTERFLAEISVTANLQHPHLLPLFDSGEADGLLFYVMPYIEGESLRAQLDRERQLPVDDAVRIAIAVASALDYAHRHDVIHRDLKPENILLHDGQPLVSDFGIALAISNAGGARITQTGLSLGTPQYMSPEQATGDRLLDARTDIYSLAAVLYEMLVGEPPHTGPTVQAIIARVLTDRPPGVRTYRDTVPQHVDAALQRALTKLPADRFATAQQFADALQNPHTLAWPHDDARGAASAALPPSRRSRLAPAALWLLVAVALGIAGWSMLHTSSAPAAVSTRFTMSLPPGVQIAAARSAFAISPAGDEIVFVGFSRGASHLYVRRLDELEATPIPGAEQVTYPFFAPDGAWIGAYEIATSRLKRFARGGRASISLANVVNLRGASWGPDDRIVWAQGARDHGLWMVRGQGGSPTRLTVVDTANGELNHQDPHFLPDGAAVVFNIVGRGSQTAELAVATLDGTVTRLGIHRTRAEYVAATGHLLFTLADGTLMAAPFDVRRRRLRGPAVPVLENIAVRPDGYSAWDVAPNGTLAYMQGEQLNRLVLVSREGAVRPLSDDARRFYWPNVSPDGRTVAVEIVGADGTRDIWIYDRTLTRLTVGGGRYPIWTRDGKRVVFASGTDNAATHDLFWQPADGSGPAEPLLVAPGREIPHAWTADSTLIYTQASLNARDPRGLHRDISTARIPFTGRPAPFANGPFHEALADLSPDGKWLVYSSNENDGKYEVFVRPFPGPGGKIQISVGGGDEPKWSLDGREIFTGTPRD